MGSSYGSIRLWWEVVENRIEVKRLPQAVTLPDAQVIVVLIVFPDRSDHCHCQTHHHPALPK